MKIFFAGFSQLRLLMDQVFALSISRDRIMNLATQNGELNPKCENGESYPWVVGKRLYIRDNYFNHIVNL